MRAVETALPEVLVLEPGVFEDDRGFFFEAWNRNVFKDLVGRDVDFVQDNQSRSRKGVLRGLHYQLRQPQGKLVRVVAGSVFDVVVDVRRSSSTFGGWLGLELSDANRRQLWIPQGFAHGFLVITEYADLVYKTTDYYNPEWDRTLRWDDPEIGIDWPLDGGRPILSAKDDAAPGLFAADVYE
ncbi:MAG: dTDP-4-dehydrorhamnose 3,5-epimerase [Acidimicrobiia bacterium]|nr:dTDP-4-dehydrorhamnose 3,5-epimerase [Acidimicrobiia bacterium]